jgi:small nuclear ribonucleoprotein (snRNP)-like protein
MRKLLAFCCALFCGTLAWADVIVMKNGDRVTGSIVSKSGKDVTIKTDKFGVVTTAWADVESVRADKPVNLVLQDGRTVQGTLATVDGKVEVVSKDATLRKRQSYDVHHRRGCRPPYQHR